MDMFSVIRMRRRLRISAVVITVVVLAACATTVGEPFSRPGDQEFVLGRTTYTDVLQRLGKPFKEGTASTNGKALKTVAYSFVTDKYPAAHPDVVGDKEMTFTFYNETLVSELFFSTLKDEHTDFDDSKVELIKQGKTTMSEVVTILGRPGGRAVYPATNQEGEQDFAYVYRQMRKGPGLFKIEFFTKVLRIVFNKDGVVTDVTFSQNGNR